MALDPITTGIQTHFSELRQRISVDIYEHPHGMEQPQGSQMLWNSGCGAAIPKQPWKDRGETSSHSSFNLPVTYYLSRHKTLTWDSPQISCLSNEGLGQVCL